MFSQGAPTTKNDVMDKGKRRSENRILLFHALLPLRSVVNLGCGGLRRMFRYMGVAKGGR